MEEIRNHEFEEEGSTMEKVYIAVGNDLQEGFKTIDWALKKWNNIPISIVLLHLCNISQDFVYTPFGKLPASSVSEEKLQVLRKYEEQKINKLLSKYVTFCGKLQVKAELLKVEKQDDSIQVLILDLISKLRITKLVMGITFMRFSSSWKSKSAISGSFYNVAEKVEYVRRKVNEAKLMIEEKKREVKVNAERSHKAEWAISLCNCRIEELEAGIKEESERREKLQGTLDSDKECIEEAKNDVEKGKAKLISLEGIREELSSKVKTTMEVKSQAEAELERVVLKKGETINEIEKLRNQRDVFNRRIEFCKEKEAMGLVSKEEVKCGYREYVAEDIRLATENYSDRLRLRSGGNWTNVYRGRIKHTTVAVKVINNRLSDDGFAAKVKLLNEIRHPNLVAIAGFCSEKPKCILFEYMHSGNLRDNLFTSQRKSRRSKILKWHDRIRIAHQVCSGLGFLHSVKPKPIVHGRLTPSKILLDRNLVPKITGFGVITTHSDQSDTKPDVMAFGVLLLHLLTGRNWPGLLKAMSMNQTSILRDLDQTAGKWPLELAKELGALAVKCSSVNRGGNMEFSTKEIMEELGNIREKADELRIIGGYEEATDSNMEEGDPNDIPSVFMCPILQEVMKNPHVAADGFSYELEAIEEWLSMGHDTSPMTNLRLDYQILTPNHTLRSLIQDWHSKRAAHVSS
ncbi:unnamed protein product [Thlaspi arvense]|uniref:RING-type E3 ubiquitin transferase n=1 Tax=Thlaspi arvense TaxID=13288 RepID=A0AAU9RL23_THLAR|nr:unnamed protein product [Thlaspi arvense]